MIVTNPKFGGIVAQEEDWTLWMSDTSTCDNRFATAGFCLVP